jgi:hypothetical protein
MAAEITLDELRARAERAGLTMIENELIKLLPGVNRSHKQAKALRDLLSQTDEPAGVFTLVGGRRE